MDADQLSERARALAAALEPLAGQVYFAPECHAEYERLGFGPSPFSTETGVAVPDGPAYFTSRGSVMGQVPGEVVAAAFAVFNPAAVVSAVDFGWGITDAETICAARDSGAVAQLSRLLGENPAGIDDAATLLQRAVGALRPEGRPLFAGLLSLDMPATTLGIAWRLADQLREFRGDCHTAAWISAGLDAVEIGLLTELFWGLPMGSYIRTRAWSKDQIEAGKERLLARGWLEGDSLSATGQRERELIEVATDRQAQPVVEVLGSDLDRLVALLEPWGASIRAGGGYLPGGPHELARR